MSSPSKYITALSIMTLAFALAAPSATRADEPIPQAYSVSPNPAPAGKAFTLYLNGLVSAECTYYSRLNATVSDNEIRLSYVANTMADPIPTDGTAGPKCRVLDEPVKPNGEALPYYGVPSYQMPALKAGTYAVKVTRMHECLYSDPVCRIAVYEESAGTLTVKDEPIATAYTITPTTMEAGKEFNLSLLSYAFNCGTTFDNLATSVVGNEIFLNFLDHANPAAICPAIYKPYGPTFKMAALKPGTYKIKANRHPACFPCLMMGETADAGTLTITAGVAKKGWFLKTPEIVAGKPFTLQLLNNVYGNCQTSFSHKSITSSEGRIMAAFLSENHPERVCVTDIRPHGPAFEMQPLKTGIYPVYVTELLECEVTAPFCAIKREMPVPSDTLVVTQTLAVLLSDLRAGASKVEMYGTKAGFTLPEGIGGKWKAELLSLNGQRISSASVTAEGGSRAEFEMGVRPDRGVYLMRLSAPDGETHMLPFLFAP